MVLNPKIITMNAPNTVKALESWSKRLKIPKSTTGSNRKITMMYKIGNHFQIRVPFPSVLAALRGIFLINGIGL